MFLFLRPRSILRLITVIFSTWLILPFLWVVLPFPSTDGDSTAWATDAMRAGKTITRVYNGPAFFPDFVTEQGFRMHSYHNPFTKDYFALDFTMDKEKGMFTINNVTVDLNYSPQPSHHKSKILVGVPASSPKRTFLPWWPYADAAMFRWQLDGAIDSIPLRIEHHWDDLSHTWELFPDLSGQPRKSMPKGGRFDQAMIRLEWDESQEFNRLFAFVPINDIGSAPSATYRIRTAILALMAPQALWQHERFGKIFRVFILFLQPLMAVVALCLYVIPTFFILVWLVRGRPAPESLLRSVNRRLRSQRLENGITRLEILHEMKPHPSLYDAALALVGLQSNGYRVTRLEMLDPEVNLTKDYSDKDAPLVDPDK